mgnify:CR=1 FL=1
MENKTEEILADILLKLKTLTNLLIKKKIFTVEEYDKEISEVAEFISNYMKNKSKN